MQIHQLSGATLSSLRACRTLKTVVKRKFFTWPSDPFVTLDLSDVQKYGKIQILKLVEQPTLSSLRMCRKLKTVIKWILTGLNRTTVKNWGEMDIFDRTEPDYGGKLQ